MNNWLLQGSVPGTGTAKSISALHHASGTNSGYEFSQLPPDQPVKLEYLPAKGQTILPEYVNM